MSTVYAVAVRGAEFLMVLNPRRGGWEMPGGSVEEGESVEEAAVREFMEEAGLRFIPVARMEREDCTVFVGKVSEEGRKGEMEWRWFDRLPEKLAFPREEYEEVLPWAFDTVLANK